MHTDTDTLFKQSTTKLVDQPQNQHGDNSTTIADPTSVCICVHPWLYIHFAFMFIRGHTSRRIHFVVTRIIVEHFF